MATEKIILPEVQVVSKNNNRVNFSIEPLSPGYGITMGNSLRRVLLSSLEGSAVYAVKITGVTHEFTTIPGVREDSISLLLNIKSISVALEGDDEAVLKLDAKGSGTVKAKDIKVPAGCKITNPELEIAHLDRKGKLNMEIFVNRGMGYVPIEKKDEKKYPLEMILVDSTYTPVEKVNFRVEDMRVGQATDYNRVLLDITTNGAITPEVALKKASTILASQFETVSSLVQEEKPKVAKSTKLAKVKKIKKPAKKQTKTKTTKSNKKIKK
ncbi:DNA-directed RNA polymerase subunit alpha [Patescibacteria group bacterium]